MRALVHHRRLRVGPAQVDVQVTATFEDGVNEAMLRDALVEALRGHWAAVDARAWTAHAASSGPKGTAEAPYHAPARLARRARPPRPKLRSRPDVKLRPHQKKLCDRLVETVLLLGARGQAVSLTGIEHSGRMPQGAASRLLKPGSDTARYLEPYLREWRDGPYRLFDLTDEGLRLASVLRAGGGGPDVERPSPR